jgi:hypothetical protein
MEKEKYSDSGKDGTEILIFHQSKLLPVYTFTLSELMVGMILPIMVSCTGGPFTYTDRLKGSTAGFSSEI